MEDVKNTQCPYCKETIILGALKCKHCGERLGDTSLSTEVNFGKLQANQKAGLYLRNLFLSAGLAAAGAFFIVMNLNISDDWVIGSGKEIFMVPFLILFVVLFISEMPSIEEQTRLKIFRSAFSIVISIFVSNLLIELFLPEKLCFGDPYHYLGANNQIQEGQDLSSIGVVIWFSLWFLSSILGMWILAVFQSETAK